MCVARQSARSDGGADQSTSSGQAKASKPAAAQRLDEEYTKLIKQNLQDPRITTELVDHLPASDTVPSPLKFLGRAVGTPGELTYAKDIYRYYEALAKAAPTRAKFWKIGTTEEGRDIVLLAIADEATIKSLDSYRDMLGELTDPRKTSEARAQQLLHTAKPIYYAISGMHSPETGGPEMLDRAGLPADRRGDAVHPEHPQQRDHADHAGDRSGRPREAGGHLLLQQEARAGRRAAAADVAGANACSTTTTATAWASSSS